MTDATNGLNRRRFLKNAAGAAAGAAAVVVPGPLSAATPEPASEAAQAPPAGQEAPAAGERVLTVNEPGSDFMVDVIKTLGIEYIASNPASSFRGLQESFVTYGGNKDPEWLTCSHEEVAVNISNGYYAVSGKPMAVVTFAPAGLHHAGMAIFGAYETHIPTYIMVGNWLDAVERRPGTDWAAHSMMDPAAVMRDILKWDDSPVSLQHFAESAVRAYKMAMTEPRGPVLLVVDATLQESANPNRGKLHIPKLTLTSPPAGDPTAVTEVAKLLVAAEEPLIVVGDAVHDEEGMRLLTELAETIQAPVQERFGAGGEGHGLLNRHPLSGGGSVRNADVILALNVSQMYSVLNTFRDQQQRIATPILKPGAKVISISEYDLYMKANYQVVDRYAEVHMALAASPQATLPGLIEACKKLITPDRQRVFAERGKKYATASAQTLERLRAECANGWDDRPISQRRLAIELWEVIKNKDWASVGGDGGRLWNVDKFYRRMGHVFGGGVGGDLPVAIGGALAHRKHGRLCVTLQRDGDMMQVPGALWTATHHRIPLLFVMHNNRAYHTEVMHLQRMANRRQRGLDDAGRGFTGTTLTDPNIDFAQVARGMGAYAEGPIADPKDLRPALLRAVERVEKGEVALVDTVVQPR